MTYVDAAILNAVERSCQWFQTLTGRTNVWIAAQLTNISIIVYFVWLGLYAWNVDLPQRVLVKVFAVLLVYALMQTILKVPIETHEAQAYRRVAKGYRNPRRVRDAPLRIAFLTLAVVLCYPTIVVHLLLRSHLVTLMYSLIVLTAAVLYLLACDPLPPAPGRLTEWLRGSVPAPLPASEPSRADLSGSNL